MDRDDLAYQMRTREFIFYKNEYYDLSSDNKTVYLCAATRTVSEGIGRLHIEGGRIDEQMLSDEFEWMDAENSGEYVIASVYCNADYVCNALFPEEIFDGEYMDEDDYEVIFGYYGNYEVELIED